MQSEERKPEEILDVNRRWLPPQPHLDKVIEAIQKGSAHIEKRGHNEPPLLVFEDGGVIELPRARYENTHRGMQLVSAPDAVEAGKTTKHRDVCGCVDEIKGTVKDAPELVSKDPHVFDQLLDDALYMITRMRHREDEYKKFVSDIIALCTNLPSSPDPKMAFNAADEMRLILHEHPADVSKYTELLNCLAEDVRYVASMQERCLAEYKKRAVAIFKFYRAVKGGRNWEKEETSD